MGVRRKRIKKGEECKENWDEYSIVNEDDWGSSAVSSMSELVWKSFDEEGKMLKANLNEEGAVDEMRDAEDAEGFQKQLIDGLKESVARNMMKVDGEEKQCKSHEEPLNISKQRYEEYVKKKGENKESLCSKIDGMSRRNEEEVWARTESNLRMIIKNQQEELERKEVAINRLNQRVSELSSSMEIKGRIYALQCICRGEELLKAIENDIESEKQILVRRIDEGVENSKVLQKKIDGLKKIVNELVKKIKKKRNVSEQGMAESRIGNINENSP
ncbi:hypothetical protein HK407_10g16100 [Ordospora pajunii]|uniref:uncharacterized protein n=1 Tax=Ordospora pajunii TaxID=3039483 RepID=UPI0029528726|nr:uncharacterized protein HK407_10g16100 [Ordospora pajunii]KAH9410844.1 hypothetical protein HK407_10g16100 [Ordospora pajunii]